MNNQSAEAMQVTANLPFQPPKINLKKAILLLMLFLIAVMGLFTSVYLLQKQPLLNKKAYEGESPPLILTPTTVPSLLPPTQAPTLTPTTGTLLTPPVGSLFSAGDSFQCTGLSASPVAGAAPLKVRFIAGGSTGEGALITGFELNYGDGTTEFIEKRLDGSGSAAVEHLYDKSGKFTASARAKDDHDRYSEVPDVCRKVIEVSGAVSQISSPSATAIPVPVMPESGNWAPVAASLLAGAVIIFFSLAL